MANDSKLDIKQFSNGKRITEYIINKDGKPVPNPKTKSEPYPKVEEIEIQKTEE